MADVGDKHFVFTRKADRELHDGGSVDSNSCMLSAKLDYMRGEKKGVLLGPCSFIGVMLELLRDNVCHLDSDGLHIIGRHGGLIAQDMEQFEEVRAWDRIAAQTLSNEFP